MSVSRALRPLVAPALALVAALVMAPAVEAGSAVLTRSGVLYEVQAGPYGSFFDAYDPADARLPVLALRTTLPDGRSSIELVDGTFNSSGEGSASVEYDETSKTVFVVYTQYQGLMSDVHFALMRRGKWSDQTIDPNSGLYLSLNPVLLVTRQKYIDSDGQGGTVAKSRSILSIVWWEESGVSQARYTSVFVEDGALDLENLVTVNLNDFAKATGASEAAGLPFSSYQYPALQQDTASNGGVFVSFANLVTQKQEVYRITFPDDLTKIPEGPGGTTLARGRIPIGGHVYEGVIPKIDVPGPVGTVLSPSGVPTFYWEETLQDRRVVRFLDGDSSDGLPIAIPLRSDFSAERALNVLRARVEKQ